MISCPRSFRKLAKGLHPVILACMLVNIVLILWNSKPCPPWPEHLSLEIPKKPHEFHQDRHSFPYNISESDLVSLTRVKLDIGKYRRLLQWKVSELKRNGVLKSIAPREPCNWDKAGGPCVDSTCKKELPDPQSTDSLASVLKPLSRLKPDAISKVMSLFGNIPKGYRITFLTASSSNHYPEAQALLKNLDKYVFPKLTNYTLYFYDLGLTDHERKQLKKWCRCTVRIYPVKRLPKRFGFLRGFTWKTFMINAHLPTTDYVLWVDSSIRFKPMRLEPMFDAIRERGLLFGVGSGFSQAEFTSKTMFDYFGHAPCELSRYAQGTAGFQMIYNDPFMRDLVFKVWTACALDPLCMCQNCSLSQISCNQDIRKYAKCHRTDQSAHSMILIKLFRENIETFYAYSGKYHYLRRHQTAEYFAELEANSSKTIKSVKH